MSIRMSLVAVAAGLAGLIGGVSLAAGQGSSPVGREGRAVGNSQGAIRSMGSTGYSAREGRKEPAVTIPPIDEGEREPRGLPRGTTGGPLRR